MGMPDPPDDQPPQSTSSSKDGALKSLSGVQSLLQLGLLLPASVVIGWAIGLALDHWLNLHWMNIVGLIAGAIAGFIQTVRVAMSHNKD
ncbi:MAG: AtpZ/AtpI family protein [Acidobacteriaceae bacterium]|jgi:ATP synthase protein I